MCNLYTLAPWEVRHLIQHYRLIGTEFEEVMRGPQMNPWTSIRTGRRRW